MGSARALACGVRRPRRTRSGTGRSLPTGCIASRRESARAPIPAREGARAPQTRSHRSCFRPVGNNGTPRLSYYKNGVLVGSLNTTFRPQDLVFVNNWLGRSNFNGDANTNASWRASYIPGGSPGGFDRQTFAEWAAANGVSDPLADDDSDGLSNALEYMLGGTNGAANGALLPAGTLAPYTVALATDNYLTLVIRRPLSADQANVSTEWSPSLSAGTWAADGVLVSSIINGDGTQTDTWRCATPASATRYFGRVKVTLP